MSYFIGAMLALGVAGFAALVGLDRERGLYPTLLVVIATYYDLFAIMGGSMPVLGAETMGLVAFVAAAALGFRKTLWIVVLALAGHGMFDAVHGRLIANPGVPAWWPGFCLSFDLAAAACLAWRLSRAAGKRRLSAGILAVAAMTASGCSAAPKDVRTAQVDGHTVAFRVLGSGRPVLVMISGLGDGMSSFQEVAPELAAGVTVIVYDRAGYGGSGPVDGERDAKAAVRELSGVLAASHVRGPYVLLGHSLGGLYAQAYAAAHPEQVAGLILEESRPAEFTRRCEAARLSMCAPTVAMMVMSPKGAQAEVAALPATLAQVEAIAGPGSAPVLVLSRHAGTSPKPMDALWAQAQDDLASAYPGAQHNTAPGGGHYIHKDARPWFVAQIHAFLVQVGARH